MALSEPPSLETAESNNEPDLRRALTGLEAENRQLREALESRALTGQAIGILMARLDIDAEVAFSYLRRRSMHENRKLLGIAKDIIQARDIPSHWDGRVA